MNDKVPCSSTKLIRGGTAYSSSPFKLNLQLHGQVSNPYNFSIKQNYESSATTKASIPPYTEKSWTTPGTYTWTVPAGVTRIRVAVCGGGGGGANNDSNTRKTAGSGGTSSVKSGATVLIQATGGGGGCNKQYISISSGGSGGFNSNYVSGIDRKTLTIIVSTGGSKYDYNGQGYPRDGKSGFVLIAYGQGIE